MGFDTDKRPCPRCGGLAYRTDHNASMDWWRICTRCGLEESFSGVWDGDGWRTRQGYRHEGPQREHRVEGRGAYCLKSRRSDTKRRGTLREDFTPDKLHKDFDMVLVERKYDPAQSYIAYFDADTGAVSLLWGDVEPPMFTEDDWEH